MISERASLPRPTPPIKKKSLGRFKVGLVCGLVGLAGGLIITAGMEGPPKTVFVKVPEVHTREVPGPTVHEAMPYPEACADLNDITEFMRGQVYRYNKYSSQAKLILEEKQMPAALVGDIAKLNAANIEVQDLMKAVADTAYIIFTVQDDVDRLTDQCEVDERKAEIGDNYYEPSDGQSTPVSDMTDLYGAE